MTFKRNGSLWDSECEWLLNCAPAALGLHGNTGSVIAMIERGGASGSSDPHEGMLRRIGWSFDDPRRARGRDIQRARELTARWNKLSADHRKVLLVHYQARDSRSPAAQHIGFCAQVALLLAPNLEGLLKALERPTVTEHRKTIEAAQKRAEAAVTAAHAAWSGGARAEAEAWLES